MQIETQKQGFTCRGRDSGSLLIPPDSFFCVVLASSSLYWQHEAKAAAPSGCTGPAPPGCHIHTWGHEEVYCLPAQSKMEETPGGRGYRSRAGRHATVVLFIRERGRRSVATGRREVSGGHAPQSWATLPLLAESVRVRWNPPWWDKSAASVPALLISAAESPGLNPAADVFRRLSAEEHTVLTSALWKVMFDSVPTTVQSFGFDPVEILSHERLVQLYLASKKKSTHHVSWR